MVLHMPASPLEDGGQSFVINVEVTFVGSCRAFRHHVPPEVPTALAGAWRAASS